MFLGQRMTVSDIVLVVERVENAMGTLTNNEWIRHVNGFSYNLYDLLVVYPLSKLYLYGPWMGGWGFWCGKSFADICASLTNTSADIWKIEQDACVDLINKNFYSILTVINVVGFYLVLFGTSRYVLLKCLFG